MFARLEIDRRMTIPWIDNGVGLKGKRILEIGCGTGASTVALAEQGAIVTGIDIDRGALSVARDRLKAYNLQAEIVFMNGADISNTYKKNDFDIR